MSAQLKTVLVFSLLLLTLYCSKSETPPTPTPTKSPPKVDQKKVESDMELRKQFASEIEQHLNKEEFDQLENIADKLTKSKERFPGGDWKLDRFYEVIRPADDEPIKVNWDDRLLKLKKWTDQKPKSIYANIALGCAQIGKAWDARGSGLVGTVSKNQFTDFTKMLKEAETTLNKIPEEMRKDCPHWYRDIQAVGLGLNYNLETMTKYYEEVTAVEPLYWSAYEGHAHYLLPRWYGQPNEWERFATEASNKIGGAEGDILYSEICWRMSRYYPADQFFKDNNVNYRRIKKSLNLRGLKYGNSVHYLNAYCILAGGIGDKTTTKALMNRIGHQWDPDLWKDKKYFDGYKKWASE
jgi:hypothetical protein